MVCQTDKEEPWPPGRYPASWADPASIRPFTPSPRANPADPASIRPSTPSPRTNPADQRPTEPADPAAGVEPIRNPVPTYAAVVKRSAVLNPSPTAGHTETMERPAGTNEPAAPGGADVVARPAGTDEPAAPGGADVVARPAGTDEPAALGGADVVARPASEVASHATAVVRSTRPNPRPVQCYAGGTTERRPFPNPRPVQYQGLPQYPNPSWQNPHVPVRAVQLGRNQAWNYSRVDQHSSQQPPAGSHRPAAVREPFPFVRQCHGPETPAAQMLEDVPQLMNADTLQRLGVSPPPPEPPIVGPRDDLDDDEVASLLITRGITGYLAVSDARIRRKRFAVLAELWELQRTAQNLHVPNPFLQPEVQQAVALQSQIGSNGTVPTRNVSRWFPANEHEPARARPALMHALRNASLQGPGPNGTNGPVPAPYHRPRAPTAGPAYGRPPYHAQQLQGHRAVVNPPTMMLQGVPGPDRAMRPPSYNGPMWAGPNAPPGGPRFLRPPIPTPTYRFPPPAVFGRPHYAPQVVMLYPSARNINTNMLQQVPNSSLMVIVPAPPFPPPNNGGRSFRPA